MEATLTEALPDTYWVQAEVASLSEKSGHGYFDLVEKGKNGMLAAKMRATCWSNIFPMLSTYFTQETGCSLQAGMQILVEVEVQYHSVYGLSLNIVNIDPRFTIGDLARQRQQTIQQLISDGVMGMQSELRLPTLCQRIAVISAETAAGYGDFCDQLVHSGYRFIPTLFPAVMQGDKAEQSILQALNAIAKQDDAFDTVVIIRGGGATTDLSCFDSYTLCATCAQFPLPILTGIGHTRDVSVLDMVAHQALKTPTAVAAFLIDKSAAESERVQLLRNRLRQTAERQILIRRHRIEMLQQRIALSSPERIYKMGYSLTTLNGKVVRCTNDIAQGQLLTTHLIDGEVQSIVQ
ncbi:MAG: exodeoxyribonuclease VII large subunit [Paludibacteraceae bacterium]|nr:exodeoxyribonuclease VII large subunit [Paludibacteraceae bacterium]